MNSMRPSSWPWICTVNKGPGIFVHSKNVELGKQALVSHGKMLARISLFHLYNVLLSPLPTIFSLS